MIGSIVEPIPTAAVLCRKALRRYFKQVVVVIVLVGGNNTVFRPSGKGSLMNPDFFGRFLSCEKTSAAKPIDSRCQVVGVNHIGNSLCIEPIRGVSLARRSAGTQTVTVENVGDFRIGVVFQKLIHQSDRFRRRPDHFGG